MKKKFLFALAIPPFNGIRVLEILDIILTVSAFDQAVSLLLLDDGVLQLKDNQNPSNYGYRDSAAIYKAFEIYDIRDIYVEVESLQERGLKPADLILPVREIYRKDVNRLMNDHQLITGL